MNDTELFQEFLEFKRFKESQQKTPTKKEQKKPKKFIPRRRAKGSGSIYSLGSGRNKPWVATITIGYDDETGRQIQKPIGYFKTQGEAQTALSAYELQHKGLIEENSLINMSDIEKPKSKCPTFKDIWDIIFDEEVSKRSISMQNNYKTAFNHLKELHHIEINKINLHTLQPIFDKFIESKSGYSKMNTMKVVCGKVYKYAMKYDYIDKDYSHFINYESIKEKEFIHTPFTNEEIKLLWSDGSKEAKLVLLYIYTGLRPIELINIIQENIHLDEKYMVGGVKTSNGKNRIIPIHDKVFPIVNEIIERDADFRMGKTNQRSTYEYYRTTLFKSLMKKLNLKHSPYDTRHTFATLCNESGLNEYLIKKMMGHSSSDLTKDVYTHATIERLVNEVNKITI